MASTAEVRILISPKTREYFQTYMNQSGVTELSQFVVDAIRFDFASRGMQDLCDDHWSGHDERTASGLYSTIIKFKGKMAGMIRSQQAVDKSPQWLSEILGFYIAFYDRPRDTPKLVFAQSCMPG